MRREESSKVWAWVWPVGLPVVLTLGSGPSSFPRKFSRRRLKLPRQPGRGASLALASVILALGACPSRNNFPGDGRSFRDSRGKPAPSLARALSFWRWGLARRASRKNFLRVTAKASATASLALASVVLALGGGRTGFPKQVSERCKAEGSWTASGRNGRFINQKRTDGQISKFGLQMADFILSRIRRLSAVKPSHFYQGLAELQLYQGRPAAAAVLWRGALLALASVILALGAGPLLPETTFRATAEASATAMANPVARARSVVLALGAGPSGFPKQFSRQPPLRSLPSFWRWGVAGRASRNER